MIVTRTNNHSIVNNEEQLAFVVILHLSEGVDGLAQGSITFSITRHLTDDELVMVFRSACRTKVDGGEKFEANDRHHDDGEDKENVGREQALWGLAIIHFPDSEPTFCLARTSLSMFNEFSLFVISVPA